MESNKIIKPDRLVFLEPNRVVIIDYKTGEKNKKRQTSDFKVPKNFRKNGLQSRGFNFSLCQ
jgi:predicted Ser/Thr protein kinase